MDRGVAITGTGMFVPERVVTNNDLSKLMRTSDEWIKQRTGIEERRFVEANQSPSDLGVSACTSALKMADRTADEIDLLVVSTLSPDHFFPGTASFLQEKLAMGTTPAMDVHCQCSGFLYALNVARAMIAVGQYERILVCGTEVHSKALEMNERGRDTAVLFGDGAGAVVLEKTDEPESGIINSVLHAEGKHADKLWVELPGLAADPYLSHAAIDEGRIFPKMDGKFVFKHAVQRMPQVVYEVLQPFALSAKDVDLFLFHQANLRINEYVGKTLGLKREQTYNNLQKYGNCSSAAIPMCLDECVRTGRVKKGSLICLTTFGAGFTWGSILIRW